MVGPCALAHSLGITYPIGSACAFSFTGPQLPHPQAGGEGRVEQCQLWDVKEPAFPRAGGLGMYPGIHPDLSNEGPSRGSQDWRVFLLV